MKKITKETLEEVMDYYHGFHDSCIKNVRYDYLNSNVEIFIDVFWSGEPSIKEDGRYETHSTKVRMVCHDVQQYNFKETYADYIDDAYLKFLKIKNKEYICFATDKENPLISVVSESIWYEEIQEEEKCIREDEIRNVHEEITKVYGHAKKIFERLKDKCELGYFNHHLLSINKELIEQEYYMPVISMQDKGDICFNFDNVSYEFYLPKKRLLNYLDVLIGKYSDKLSIYTSANCDIDLYMVGDTVSDVDKRLEEYSDDEVMGITIDANSFSEQHIVDYYLELINLFDEE